ncbi:hypothetical protein ACQJBY_041268 [Aegilops geniculata]
MSNPCECSRRRAKFIMQMRGNFKDSMIIPERLVDHFGRKISGTIQLEAPDGQMYVVGVAKKMNRLVLQSGWEAFVHANQIQDNSYLIFRNLGLSCFKVTIFDSHGEERISCRAGAKISTHVEKASTYAADISSSSFDGASDSEGRKSGKAHAVNSSSDESSAEDSQSEGESMESDDLQGLSKDYVLAGRCNLTEEQEDEIKGFVAKIRPETPVLVVMMKKTNVNHYPNLVISKDYAHAYFPHKTQFVTLKLPGKSKAWPCKFRIRPDGRGRNLSLREFVHDNRVKKGDLCLFQPMTEVQSTRFTFMVHLLRKVGRTDICSNQGEDSPSEYESIQSDHQETSSEVRYILSRRCRLDEEDEVIPKRYAAAHFPTESQNIILTLPGVKKKWHPLFHVRRGNIGYVLYGRWLEFVRDNRLREGDICLLQPINRGEGRRFMLTVHLLPKARRAGKSKGGDVVRGSKIGGTSTKAASTACVKEEPVDDGSDRPGYVVLGCSARLTQEQEKVVAEKVKAVRSQAPVYVAAMDKGNLSSALDLRTTGHAAADGHLLPDGKQTLTLRQAGWSKAWRVEMRHRRMVPAGGWREFAADNRLQAGDLCLLEPVADKRLAMAVHIIRREQWR